MSGASKKDFIEKTLSQDLEKVIEDKTTLVVKSPDEKPIQILSDDAAGKRYTSQVVVPIVSEGDPIGAVILLSTDPNARMGEVESKLAQSAAGFLGKQMEQ